MIKVKDLLLEQAQRLQFKFTLLHLHQYPEKVMELTKIKPGFKYRLICYKSTGAGVENKMVKRYMPHVLEDENRWTRLYFSSSNGDTFTMRLNDYGKTWVVLEY